MGSLVTRLGEAPGSATTGWDLMPSVPASSPKNKNNSNTSGSFVRTCCAKPCEVLRIALGTEKAMSAIFIITPHFSSSPLVHVFPLPSKASSSHLFPESAHSGPISWHSLRVLLHVYCCASLQTGSLLSKIEPFLL